jgi:hypothetical protein
MKLKILTLLLAATISSCTHLTHQEETQWKHLKDLGVKESDQNAVANPGTAGALNILPGVGNFYLASGNGGDSGHWIYGALNLLTWPVSIIWGVPEAAIDAGTINKREILYHYNISSSGKEELKKLEQAASK